MGWWHVAKSQIGAPSSRGSAKAPQGYRTLPPPNLREEDLRTRLQQLPAALQLPVGLDLLQGALSSESHDTKKTHSYYSRSLPDLVKNSTAAPCPLPIPGYVPSRVIGEQKSHAKPSCVSVSSCVFLVPDVLMRRPTIQKRRRRRKKKKKNKVALRREWYMFQTICTKHRMSQRYMTEQNSREWGFKHEACSALG